MLVNDINMKLTMIDNGSQTTGISPQSFSIDCPFNWNEEIEHKEDFAEKIEKLFSEYSHGKIYSYYSFLCPVLKDKYCMAGGKCNYCPQFTNNECKGCERNFAKDTNVRAKN